MLHHNVITALKEIDKFFKMKEGSVGDPDFYLGAKLRKMTLPNGVEAWSMIPRNMRWLQWKIFFLTLRKKGTLTCCQRNLPHRSKEATGQKWMTAPN